MKFKRVFVLLAILASLLLAGASQSGAPIAVTGDFAVEASVDENDAGSLDYVWAGKRLTRHTSDNAQSPSAPSADSVLATSMYTGTLAPIAARLGTSVKAMLDASKLYNPGLTMTGQRLSTLTKMAPAPLPSAGKWIDVDIGSQTIMAYQGSSPIKTVLMSSGLGIGWTPTGSYKVYLKVPTQTMSGGIGGEHYYLPNVPWILYYSGDNAIHGAYWHNNFGFPMSHGCINVSIQDAKWFYDWGQVGMPVIVHM